MSLALYQSFSEGAATHGWTNVGGNFLVAFLRLPFASAGVPVLTDNNGNTWVKDLEFSDGVDINQLWHAASCNAGPATITITGSSFTHWIAGEFSTTGAALTALDQINHVTSGSTNTPVTGSITPTQAGELMVGFIVNPSTDGASCSPNAGWTYVNDYSNNPEGFWETSGTLGNSYTFGSTQGGTQVWYVVIASYKTGGGGGGGSAKSVVCVMQ